MTDMRYTHEVPAVTHEEGMLLCPICGPGGYGYLHHGVVKNYDRRSEDGDTVTVTTITGSSTRVEHEPNGPGNPSRRRDGLTIQFWCETCGAKDLELTLAQHKGQTFVSWRRPLGGDWPK